MAIVSFETVAAAAEALQVAGQRPSVRAVIAHLGGGSPNAVLKHLGEWKAGRPLVRVADTDLDPRITTAIVDQMQRVAAEAAAAAEERAAGIEDDLQALAEAQQAAEQQIEGLTTENAASRQLAEGLARQLADAQADAERREQQHGAALAALRAELAVERKHQERSSADLARAEVRLEALPALHTEIERLRAEMDKERQGRVASEQQTAVMAAKLEAAIERAAKAEAAAVEATAQARASHEAVALEAVKAETAHNTMANLTGKFEAMQAQIQQQAHELAATRQEAKKASEEAAELRGKHAGNAELKPAKKAAKTE